MGKKGGKKEKDVEESKTVLLGRPGNNVKMGIVGLPNVGKSSFFNILCNVSIPAENFPFCTIEPNEAKVEVPDKRFDTLVKKWKPKSVVPAVLTVNDIAGLVKGASTGAGLGNAFLSHIAAADGIYHMIRSFSDSDVSHVEGSVDPLRDIEIIHSELRIKDLQRIDGNLAALAKKVRGKDAKAIKAEMDFLAKCKEKLEEGVDIRCATWKGSEIEMLNNYHFLTAKPVIYLVNMKKKNFLKKGGKWLAKIAAHITERSGDKIIPLSVAYEQELLDAGPEGAAKIIQETGAKSALPKIVKTGYHALHLCHFFTVGPDEVRAWTVKQGTGAQMAAAVIHTDISDAFQSAEVYAYKDYKSCEYDVAAVKSAGKLRTEGRKYEVQDGDIVFFKHNAGGGKKKKK